MQRQRANHERVQPSTEVRRLSSPPASGWRTQQLTARAVARLKPVVEAALRRVTTRRDPDFEDLVQSSLEGVIAAIDGTREEKEHSTQWISAIARNIAIDRLRAPSPSFLRPT